MVPKFYSTIIRPLVILFATFFYVTGYAQKFGKHEVCLPDNGILTATVKILPPYTFSVKKDNQLTWVEYEISDNFVFFKASVNKTKENRFCSFTLLDGEGNPVDTIKIKQLGIVANKASAKAVSTKKSSTSTKSYGGGQCAARTKKGTRCSRKTSAGSIYCWQHRK